MDGMIGNTDVVASRSIELLDSIARRQQEADRETLALRADLVRQEGSGRRLFRPDPDESPSIGRVGVAPPRRFDAYQSPSAGRVAPGRSPLSSQSLPAQSPVSILRGGLRPPLVTMTLSS